MRGDKDIKIEKEEEETEKRSKAFCLFSTDKRGLLGRHPQSISRDESTKTVKKTKKARRI